MTGGSLALQWCFSGPALPLVLVRAPTHTLVCAAAPGFDSSREYLYQDCLYGLEGRPAQQASSSGGSSGSAGANQHQQEGGEAGVHYGPQWAYLRFSHPVTAPPDSLVIGSRLDADLQAASCR